MVLGSSPVSVTSQTMQFTNSPQTFNFRIYKVFSHLSALQTLVPPNLYLLLRLSCLVNVSNVSYSNKLNRLNRLGPYQKFVPIDNAWVQALFSKAV